MQDRDTKPGEATRRSFVALAAGALLAGGAGQAAAQARPARTSPLDDVLTPGAGIF